jgi:zinc/manganese transport system substrate-binding protein
MQGMRIGFDIRGRVLCSRAVRLALLSGLIGLWACSTGTSAAGTTDEDRIAIVATTSILGDVVSNVVGDAADVEVVLPAGTDPHDFEPSPQQVAAIGAADLVVANGLGLEEGLADVIEAASAEGTPVLQLADGLDPIPRVGSQGTEALGESQDPHFWHDPDRMARAIDLIASELSMLDASVDWQGEAAPYRAEVTAAGIEADEILSEVPTEQRVLVTSHDSLGYFADRFGFTVVATVIPGGSTMAEPSGREIAELVDTIDTTGVSAIFADATNSTALAETVAAEAGRDVEVVVMFTDTLGEPGSGADSYLGMILTNADLVADALSTR